MKLLLHTPVKSLNKAYLRQSLKRDQIELLKANLGRMLERIRTDDHEEHLKNIVSDFLKDTWYKQTNEINISGRTDLVIHNGKNIPIPPATDVQKAPIIERVQKILAAPDGPDVPQLEAEIDRLIYALYNLTDAEIALVEGKK